ncbi:MAG: HAD family hydrolase [Nitrospiraceae bacterium]|nr:HAD family hydrolase [Nitrospiraceae bacterium]
MKLVLFDIDGTLLDSGGAGSRALDAAFLQMFSIDNAFRGISMCGKTDTEIINEALDKHGIVMDGQLPAFIRIYLEHLRAGIDNPGKKLKPGVKDALNALEIMKDMALGLLTGNIEEGARTKLKPFGLNEYFPSGAFGSDNADRNVLLPIALERFRTRHPQAAITFEDCTVIGDTPRDVECAKLHGAHAIAVATGRYTAAELLATRADLVLNDLSDTAGFLKGLNF